MIAYATQSGPGPLYARLAAGNLCRFLPRFRRHRKIQEYRGIHIELGQFS